MYGDGIMRSTVFSQCVILIKLNFFLRLKSPEARIALQGEVLSWKIHLIISGH